MASTANTTSFRRATKSDAQVLVDLTNLAFGSDTTTQAWSGTERMPIVTLDGMLEKKLQPPTAHVLLAIEDSSKQILGMCCVSVLDESRTWPSLEQRSKTGPSVWVDSLALLPRMHGTGLGARLVKYAEDYAVEKFGAERFMLDMVSSRTELMAWYGRRGYVRTEETKEFEYKDELSRRLLQPGLEFVVLVKDVDKV